MMEAPVADLQRNSLPVTAKNGEPTLTDLVSGIADDAQRLIRQQYQMLRAEVREDIRRTKTVAKYFSVGIAAMFVGGLFLIVATPLLLNWLFGLADWAGWAIVGGVAIVFGGIALFIGKRKFDRFSPLPDKTLNALEENLSWITNHRN